MPAGKNAHLVEKNSAPFKMPLSQTIIGICGNVVSMGLFLSPAPTFWKIIKKKSTQQFSALPYVCTLLNCLLWLFYGSPWVVQGILVVTINGIGTGVEIIYLVIFLLFASSRQIRLRVLAMISCVVCFFALVVVLNMAVVHEKSHRKTVVGVLCVIVGTAMYAAPLSVMRTVMKTKSTEYMPFWLSFFSFLNGVLWTTYALIGRDVYITVPNALGTALGLIQLVLYGCYCGGSRDGHGPQFAADKTVDTDIELAHARGNEKHIEHNNGVDRS